MIFLTKACFHIIKSFGNLLGNFYILHKRLVEIMATRNVLKGLKVPKYQKPELRERILQEFES